MKTATPTSPVRRVASCPSLQFHAPAVDSPSINKPRSLSVTSANLLCTESNSDDIFDDDMDDDPGSHFLADASPEPYECRFGIWDSDGEDDDDDDDSYELNPNIIDFTLFSDAAKRAKETQQPLDPQWDRLIASQRGAFARTLGRTSTSPIPLQRPRFLDDLPDLTPDSSPHMKDDGGRSHRPSIPQDRLAMPPPRLAPRPNSYPTGLRIRHGPDQPLFQGMEMDEDELNSLYLPESAYLTKRLAALPVPRPGLRGSHTLSGHSHSWRRPSFELPTVCEESEATTTASHSASSEDEENSRGRRRSQ